MSFLVWFFLFYDSEIGWLLNNNLSRYIVFALAAFSSDALKRDPNAGSALCLDVRPVHLTLVLLGAAAEFRVAIEELGVHLLKRRNCCHCWLVKATACIRTTSGLSYSILTLPLLASLNFLCLDMSHDTVRSSRLVWASIGVCRSCMLLRWRRYSGCKRVESQPLLWSKVTYWMRDLQGSRLFFISSNSFSSWKV